MNMMGKKPHADNVSLAVGAIIVSVLALSAGDAIIKLSSTSFPVWQIYVLRSALIIPILLLMLSRQKHKWSVQALFGRWVLARSVLLALMWVAYYSALPEIDLAMAAAGYYTAPLLITLLSAQVTGDRVSTVVLAAVALGFAGVLVMLRPGSVPLTPYIVLPFIAALLYAMAMVVTRVRCSYENPVVLALALNIMFIFVGALATMVILTFDLSQQLGSYNPFLFGSWATLGGREWLVIVALATMMLIGSVGAAIAYQSGPAPVVATFDYTYLIFAGLWGLLVFAEVPDPVTVLGMLMILAGGVLSLWRRA